MFLTEMYVVCIGTHSNSHETTPASHTWIDRNTAQGNISMYTWIVPLVSDRLIAGSSRDVITRKSKIWGWFKVATNFFSL